MEFVISNSRKESPACTSNVCVKCATSSVESMLLPGTKQLKVSWMESVKCFRYVWSGVSWTVLACFQLRHVWSEIPLFHAMLSPLRRRRVWYINFITQMISRVDTSLITQIIQAKVLPRLVFMVNMGLMCSHCLELTICI